jgi:hypothetical protein
MLRVKPVEIKKWSFAFCRYGIAIAIWISFIFRIKFILWIVSGVFLLSVLFRVKHAPMILLGNVLFKPFDKPGNNVWVNEYAILFAHFLGLIFSLICVGLVCFSKLHGAWISVLFFALLKSVSAFGFCPGAKLYECLFGGTCCVRKFK